MATETDQVKGYVIDVACVRKNSRGELMEKAQNHSKECALMGHCVESGYGLVSEDDRLALLDPKATRKAVDVIEDSEKREGIRLRVTREERDGTMESTTVEEV